MTKSTPDARLELVVWSLLGIWGLIFGVFALRTRRRISLCLLLLLAVVLVSCTGGRNGAEVETIVVQPGTLEVLIEEVGLLEATNVVSIVAPFSGKIIYLPETGAMVREGDNVLVLESEEDVTRLKDRLNELKTVKSELEGSIESLQIALRSNLLDVDFGESQLAVQRVRLEDVNQRLAETEILLDKAVVPEDDLRSAVVQVESRRLGTVSQDLDLRGQVVDKQSDEAVRLLDIERKELQGMQARRKLEEARARVESSQSKAPVAGMFLRKGTWVWHMNQLVEPRPGDTVRRGQLVGEIPDLNSLVIKTQIAEGDLHRVATGMAVRLRFDAYQGLELRGRIVDIGKVAIEREASAAGALVSSEGYSGQKVFEVLIAFDTPDARLKPGITAQVSILVERRENVLSIPIEAIQRRDGANWVSVALPGGGFEQRAVELGLRSHDAVSVTSGLQAGDRIAKTHRPAGRRAGA